jgi:glycine cleavage system pyridoxal-binding protein P
VWPSHAQGPALVAGYAAVVKRAKAAGVMTIAATDLLALTLIKSPGEDGAVMRCCALWLPAA